MHTYMYSFAPLRSILAQREQHTMTMLMMMMIMRARANRIERRVGFGSVLVSSERANGLSHRARRMENE